MYSPLSQTWDSKVRSNAAIIARADLYADPSSDIVTLADLPLSSWKISVDRNSSIRRTAQVTIMDEEILAEVIAGRSGLQPYGSEIRMNVGFENDLIPVGIFQVEDLSWDESETTLSISLFDRGQALQRSSYGLELDASGKQALAFIQETVNDLLPYVAFIESVDNNIRFPGGTTYRSGRLQAVQEAAQALGAEFYFDVNGSAVVTPIPFVDALVHESDYNWLVNTGEDGVLISYNRKITRKDTYNKIHVMGAPATQTSPQPYGFASDDNPASPTYYGGPFGKADQRIERQELTTDSQCRTYALAQLRNATGLSRNISLDSLCNPALDAGDVIRVDFPDGTFELHMVDRVDFDQTGKMSIDTRARQTP